MEIMLFCLVMAYVLKNGTTDIIDAVHGRTPARYVTAQKRADAKAVKAGSRAAKYRAKAGRSPRRSTVRPYLRALWHDAVEDSHKRHDRRRTERAARPVEPSAPKASRPAGLRALAVPAGVIRSRSWSEAPDQIRRAGDPDGDEGYTLQIRREPGGPVESRTTADRDEFEGWRSAAAEDPNIAEYGGTYMNTLDDPPTPEDGDQLATVTPITEGIHPMTAPTTEVTGITTAIAFAEETGESCTEAVTTLERLAAFYTQSEMEDLAGVAVQMQEKFGSLAADCQSMISELQRFLSVKEQYATVGNQGTKEAIVNE